MPRRSGSFLLALAALYLVSGSTAAADTFGVSCITNTSAVNCGAGAAQLSVDVTDAGSNRIAFTFHNVGPAASSITDIYWEDGVLLSIFSITNTPGLVQFSSPASPPVLPGGNNLSPPFVASFFVQSDAPAQPRGVNPGEALTVTFNLIGGQTFANAIQAISQGDLRIGIHVQGFSNGGSESFVVPEPGTLVLLSGGLLSLAIARRRRADR
jgi:hypothetical protein